MWNIKLSEDESTSGSHVEESRAEGNHQVTRLHQIEITEIRIKEGDKLNY